MKNRHVTPIVVALALALTLVIAPAAFAQEQPSPLVKVSGEVQIVQNDTRIFAAFEAKSIGPTDPVMNHQPARGMLAYRDESGLSFRVSVQHIHAHMANEVHFGGVIVKASDLSLLGKHAHMVAVDNGASGDLFSVYVTEAGTHEHAAPVTLERGNLVVKVR